LRVFPSLCTNRRASAGGVWRTVERALRSAVSSFLSSTTDPCEGTPIAAWSSLQLHHWYAELHVGPCSLLLPSRRGSLALLPSSLPAKLPTDRLCGKAERAISFRRPPPQAAGRAGIEQKKTRLRQSGYRPPARESFPSSAASQLGCRTCSRRSLDPLGNLSASRFICRTTALPS